jgi:hypothetical protein
MRPKVGDKVHVPGCRFSSGTHYIEELELIEIAEDHIKLRHLRTITKAGDEPGRDKISKEPLEMLDYFSTSFQDRWQKHIDDVNWLSENLLSPNDK